MLKTNNKFKLLACSFTECKDKFVFRNEKLLDFVFLLLSNKSFES